MISNKKRLENADAAQDFWAQACKSPVSLSGIISSLRAYNPDAQKLRLLGSQMRQAQLNQETKPNGN